MGKGNMELTPSWNNTGSDGGSLGFSCRLQISRNQQGGQSGTTFQGDSPDSTALTSFLACTEEKKSLKFPVWLL